MWTAPRLATSLLGGSTFLSWFLCSSHIRAPMRETLIGVDEGSGQLRPYVRPHMRASLVKLFLHPRPLRVCAPWRISIVFQGGALVTAGHFPANLTSGGTMSLPRSRIRDGRAPGGRHHSVRRRLSRQAGQRRRPLGSVCPCRFAARVPFATTIRARASAPRPLVPRPGSHTATKRSVVAVPSPPP